jgi:uncharacterized protein (TIGR03435 family)
MACVRLLIIFLPFFAGFRFVRGISAQVENPTTSLQAPEVRAPIVSFEVISIKPSAADCALVMIGPSEDGFHLHCLSLLQMTQYAYGLNLFEEGNVLGMPKWAVNDRFDLDAPIRIDDRSRFEALLPLEKARLVRTALEERFALRSHEEHRDMPVYALVRGKPPLKLTPTDPKVAEKPTLISKGRDRIQGYHCTMEEFASYISPLRGRPVVDRTGVVGKYDFSLDFTPETSNSPATGEDVAPSIFTSVQEELGLRLIPEKASVTVLVVDGVSRPEPN